MHTEHSLQIFRFVEIKRACVKIQILVTDFIHTDVNTFKVIKMEIIIERIKILRSDGDSHITIG